MRKKKKNRRPPFILHGFVHLFATSKFLQSSPFSSASATEVDLGLVFAVLLFSSESCQTVGLFGEYKLIVFMFGLSFPPKFEVVRDRGLFERNNAQHTVSFTKTLFG